MTTATTIPDEFIIPDVTIGPLPAYEPADAFDRMFAQGYRSLLSVRIPVADTALHPDAALRDRRAARRLRACE